MSATGQQETSALRLAEWKARAAEEGKPLHTIIINETRQRLGVLREGRTVAGQAWFDLPDTSKRLLLELVTFRTPELKWRQPWEAFTPDQRAEIGALARLLRRELDQAGRLL